MEGRLRTCKKWHKVYSPAIGKMVRRCAEFGDISEYGYNDVGTGISSFFEDIGIDLEDVKNIAIAGAIGGAGLVGVSALINKIPPLQKFVANKPLAQKMVLAGVPVLLAVVGKRFAPQYSEYFNALAIAGISFAVANSLATGMGIPLAGLEDEEETEGLEAVEPEVEGLEDEEETEGLEAVEPAMEGFRDDISIEDISDEIEIA